MLDVEGARKRVHESTVGHETLQDFDANVALILEVQAETLEWAVADVNLGIYRCREDGASTVDLEVARNSIREQAERTRAALKKMETRRG